MKLHPLHDTYLSRLGGGTVDVLFRLFDALGDMKLLTESLALTYLHVIDPAVREPTSVHDSLGDQIEEPVSHARFKEKVRALATNGAEELLVAGIVHQALCYILSRANADIEETRRAHQGVIDNARELLEGELADWQRSQTEEVIEMSERHIRTFPQVVADYQKFYTKFCEVVLAGLIRDNTERSARALDDFRRNREGRELSEEEFPGAPKELPDG